MQTEILLHFLMYALLPYLS